MATDGHGTALITGASMGIGLELARVFARHQHPVVLVARSRDKLEALATELRQRHAVTAWVIEADLADEKAAQAIFDEVERRAIQVDYLVNNAGFGSTGPFVDADYGRQLDMIRVNVTALTALTHLFGRKMVERKRGGVLNIASTAGFPPGPNMAVYYATKAFVVSFTEAIAHEFRTTGVGVTAYCPGPVSTEFPRIAGNAETKLFKAGSVAAPHRVAEDAYRALMKGKVLKIQGFMNWISVQVLRVSPRSVVRSFVGWINATH